jgi:FtsP/CotA-like multicopper oxidase with cupredoxin domain
MYLWWKPVSGSLVAGATLLGLASFNVNPGLLNSAASFVSTAAAQTQGPTPPFTAGCQLVEPPVVSSQNGVLNLNLNATPATVNLSGDAVTTHVYNPNSRAVLPPGAAQCLHQSSVWLPPTMQVNPGDSLFLNLANNQTDTAWDNNIHYHGMHVTPGFDAEDPTRAGDNTFLDIPPGGNQNYELDIPKDNPVGTYWYHDHHTPAEPQLFSGQAGLLKVGNLDSMLPSSLQHITDRTLMLKDMQFVPGTATVDVADAINSNAPTTRLVNGELQPFFPMQIGEVQHWTFANTGADIYYDIQFDNHVFYPIGVDGNPVFKITQQTHLLMPPGKRFDVLVTTNKGDQAGGTGTIRTLKYVQGVPAGDTYPDTVLANVKFSAPPQAAASQFASQQAQVSNFNGSSFSGETISRNTPIDDTRTVYFNEDSTAGTFAINMQPLVQTTQTPLPPVMVPSGHTTATGLWTIANTTGENHDWHIHINPFLVVAISDPNASCPNSLVPYNPYSLEDVLNLPQALPTATAVQCAGESAPTTLHFGKIVFLTQWKDFFGQFVGDPQGRIMLHCHIEAHLDNGMITWFEVIRQGGDTLPSDSKD